MKNTRVLFDAKKVSGVEITLGYFNHEWNFFEEQLATRKWLGLREDTPFKNAGWCEYSCGYHRTSTDDINKELDKRILDNKVWMNSRVAIKYKDSWEYIYYENDVDALELFDKLKKKCPKNFIEMNNRKR